MHSWVFKCREKITAMRNSHMARNVSPIYSVIILCRTAANSLFTTEILFTARGVKLNVTEDKSINFPPCHTNQTHDLLKSIFSLNSFIKNTIKSTTVLPIFICPFSLVQLLQLSFFHTKSRRICSESNSKINSIVHAFKICRPDTSFVTWLLNRI